MFECFNESVCKVPERIRKGDPLKPRGCECMRGRRGDLEPDIAGRCSKKLSGKLSSTQKQFLLLYTHTHRLKDAVFFFFFFSEYGRLGCNSYIQSCSVLAMFH